MARLEAIDTPKIPVLNDNTVKVGSKGLTVQHGSSFL